MQSPFYKKGSFRNSTLEEKYTYPAVSEIVWYKQTGTLQKDKRRVIHIGSVFDAYFEV